MLNKRITFANRDGLELSASLSLPLNQHPHNFALFAHCFTCSKNLSAVKNISEALARKGFGVLRFDFTGLGSSEGDFADTNFSSNVEDLIDAADFLKQNYQAPAVIIGHSLGGAAAIFAAAKIASIKAIATVGAPSSPKHVTHLLQSGIEEIEREGKATVQLAGRPFTIKKQFIEDLQSQDLAQVLVHMRKPILVMHSPQDDTVGIENAGHLYDGAFHPKSFVSLDGADHLLTRKEDSAYVGEVIGSWAHRYVDIPEKTSLSTTHKVVASLDGEEGFTTNVQLGNHLLIADEPADVGGNDFGPTPYDLVAAGLATCTAMTMKMYAARKKWDLQEVNVHVNHEKNHCLDCENVEDTKAMIDHFERIIEIKGDLDEKQQERLLWIANKCPVHKTLLSDVEIRTQLL